MTIDFAKTGLPIVDCLGEISAAFEKSSTAILEAAPGAGKTTLVPLYLLHSGLLGDQKIIMLEPRRLAARAAAHRMAALLGEDVGQTVGYRVRLDSKVSRQTRIEVVTEGILTRRIQADPELAGVGLVIFDEFHERSLQTDLGLAFSRQVQEILRDDLKLLLMSATIEGGRLSNALDGAPVIKSEGRQFPVETRFLSRPSSKRIEQTTAAVVEQAFLEAEGDILVFLPGVGEISRTQKLLSGSPMLAEAQVLTLYGSLPLRDQDRAVLPDIKGRRKIVLSTDIAETSLTIEGVKIVIDAGLARSPVFDPNSGMTSLVTRKVARASADQRRGRSGRQGPGVCYRLWTAAEDRGLIEFASPEIMTADLSPLVLELANWGIQDVSDLFWMDAPPPGLIAQGKDMLQALGALDVLGKITNLGRDIVKLPLHPRLAGMVLRARKINMDSLAVDIAALLSERDILRRDREFPNSDIGTRLELLDEARKSRTTKRDGGPVTQVLRLRDDLARRLSIKMGSKENSLAGLLLAFAYPDRIGELRERSEVQYRLSGGRGARLGENDKLKSEPFLVVAELDGKGRDARIDLAAPISLEDIETYFQHQISSVRRVYWDEKKERVIAVSERKLGAVVLDQKRIKHPAPEEISTALLTAIKGKELKPLPWNTESLAFLDRVKFVRLHDTGGRWPDLSMSALEETLEDWLLPFLAGKSSLSDLQELSMLEILKSRLSWEQQLRLEKLAPPSVKVPSGSQIRLDFSNPENPVLAVRLQEVFGLYSVPKLAEGRVPVSIHLLSPARRPVQITQDLASFWQNTYVDVKKDLKGRYPKHYWPDDPMQAEATHRVKPRKT
ncbi:ATP-dependent helicase HrpB [Sneathiella litorea]|uniref:ATP-dependent helicase HrpB n=1 Tax=Sneathiella litorea TaxID=2606216 RepID=A0A6L8WA63_9PROT|nr:ATP-dependent helicase HrpB [Sneathiella litorea]MZR31320.1 ATP-dependent helicase HrpB [Sneathiella litorea]